MSTVNPFKEARSKKKKPKNPKPTVALAAYNRSVPPWDTKHVAENQRTAATTKAPTENDRNDHNNKNDLLDNNENFGCRVCPGVPGGAPGGPSEPSCEIVTLACGHSFCKGCITKFPINDKNKLSHCPCEGCSFTFDKEKQKPDLHLRELNQNLLTGKLGEALLHKKNVLNDSLKSIQVAMHELEAKQKDELLKARMVAEKELADEQEKLKSMNGESRNQIASLNIELLACDREIENLEKELERVRTALEVRRENDANTRRLRVEDIERLKKENALLKKENADLNAGFRKIRAKDKKLVELQKKLTNQIACESTSATAITPAYKNRKHKKSSQAPSTATSAATAHDEGQEPWALK